MSKDDIFNFGRLFGTAKKEPVQADSTQSKVAIQKKINEREREIETWRAQKKTYEARAIKYREEGDEEMMNEMFDEMEHLDTRIETSANAKKKLRDTMTSFSQVDVLLDTTGQIGDANDNMRLRIGKEMDMDRIEETLLDNKDINSDIKEINKYMKQGTKSNVQTKKRSDMLASIDAKIDAKDDMKYLNTKDESLPKLNIATTKQPINSTRQPISLGGGGGGGGSSISTTTATSTNNVNNRSTNASSNNNSNARQTNAKTRLFSDF